MQDNYVGDIGDYGKYGLLRAICENGLSLSVNWYKVVPEKKNGQDDGKYISYLSNPQKYRSYDPQLFDALYSIVCTHNDRRIERVEAESLFPAEFFSEKIEKDRQCWHKRALDKTADADVVFLDPDNGLESENMFRSGRATEKHVKWGELKDYYNRGQDVILYQHRPQMTPKEKCIGDILKFQEQYLKADCVKLLEFPKYTNRFYFIFLHSHRQSNFNDICNLMVKKWGNNSFCREITL